MNIVFAGTPDFAVPVLRALAEDNQYRILAVYTQPDRRAGRGQRLQASAAKQVASELGLTVQQPFKLDGHAVSELQALQPDVIVVVAYGLILPKAVLELSPYGCVNVHASLLPRWRGAAPVARAIEAGDSTTGVTIMQMDEGLDTGPILDQSSLPIGDTDTSQTLHDRLAELGAERMLDTLERLAAGNITAHPQDETLASYARKLKKQEAMLNWAEPASRLDCKIRAFNPQPVAHTRFRQRGLRIWEARPREWGHASPSAVPGEVVATDRDGIHVLSGNGVLSLRQLQLEGGKPMSAEAFINGHAPAPGEHLG
ncbi:MAG: methionyl-tRNA formyltransferase [Proteobacteria bacterium]|nr:MAG: methionyl-tRNA formyltransferase [Pseudomonadota bacterium]TDJ73801.1 MAG: methionyl-tRNA formyltransferase [Pseudomonadota bacterium]